MHNFLVSIGLLVGLSLLAHTRLHLATLVLLHVLQLHVVLTGLQRADLRRGAQFVAHLGVDLDIRSHAGGAGVRVVAADLLVRALLPLLVHFTLRQRRFLGNNTRLRTHTLDTALLVLRHLLQRLLQQKHTQMGTDC